MRQHLVLHLDQPDRVLGALLGVRGEGRDLIALIHHLLVGAFPAPDVVSRLDAGRVQRRRHVDGHDARVGMRRAVNPAVEHARPGDVVGVLGAARDLVRAVDPLDPVPTTVLVAGQWKRGSAGGGGGAPPRPPPCGGCGGAAPRPPRPAAALGRWRLGWPLLRARQPRCTPFTLVTASRMRVNVPQRQMLPSRPLASAPLWDWDASRAGRRWP